MISNTAIRDLQPVAHLQALENLTAWNVRIRDLGPLRKLGRLAHLVLGGTDVSDLSPLRRSRSLVALNLERTPVRDLRPLYGLQSLKFLHLAGTRVSKDDLDALKKANRALRVSGCGGAPPTPCLKPPPVELPIGCRELLQCCLRSKVGRRPCASFRGTLTRLQKMGAAAQRQLKTLCAGQRSRWRRHGVDAPRCP